MSAIMRRFLVARQNSPNSDSKGVSDTTKYGIIVSVSLLAIFVALFMIITTLKAMRLSGRKPTLLPSKWLKNKWNNWRPNGVYVEVSRTNLDDRHPYDPGALEELRPTTTRESATSTMPNLPPTGQGNSGILGRMSTLRRAVTRAAGGVDRTGSIRSIMTLPRYSKMAGEHEEVLGREGERDGVDEIVVFPETAEEELGRYNDEAEELYQIRVARRRENSERRERQQARRAARDAGDLETLRELQAESRRRTEAAANDPTSSSTLLANRQGSRERRVSAVSYAALGVARHDGSRVRRTSGDSERPLMDSASGISQGRSSRATSMSSQLTLPVQGTEPPMTESPIAVDSPEPGVQRTGTLPPTYSETPLTGHTSTSSLSSPVPTPAAEHPAPSYEQAQTAAVMDSVGQDSQDQRRQTPAPAYQSDAWENEYRQQNTQQQGFSDAQRQPVPQQPGFAPPSHSQSPPVASPTTPVIRINDGRVQYPPQNAQQN